jgi:hypothetical protein
VHQQTVALVNERANDQHLAPFAFQLIRESRETESLPVPRHTDLTDHGVQPPCGLLFAFALKIPFFKCLLFSVVRPLVTRIFGDVLKLFSGQRNGGPAIAGDSVVEIDLFANIREIGRYRPGATIAGRSKSLKIN